MKVGLIIWLFIFLYGCTQIDPEEMKVQEPVLAAVLYSGQNPAGINYLNATGDDLNQYVQRRASIRILDGEGAVVDLEFSPEGYSSTEPFVVNPSGVYEILVDDGDIKIRSTVVIPPAINLESLSEDTISISGPGAVASILHWSALDTEKFSYVLKLENLEENKVLIPFDGDKFSQHFAGPQINSNILLLKNDFKFYGLHQLTIYAIRRDFESVFFYDASDIRGFLRNAPDNVAGANGYTTGVSKLTVDFVVEI